jgi:hypothetical protein
MIPVSTSSFLNPISSLMMMIYTLFFFKELDLFTMSFPWILRWSLSSLKTNLAVEGFSVLILKDSFEEEKERVPDTFMIAEIMESISSLDISVFFVISLLTI